MAYYWVNHGSSSVAERAGGFFWSPNKTPAFQHHRNVGLFNPGDIIICKGYDDIDYIAIIKTTAVNNFPVPATHAGGWAGNGYYATADYFPAPCPRTASELYTNPLLNSALSSAVPKLISSSGITTQTYACRISDHAGLLLLSELGFNSATGIVAPSLSPAGAVIAPATSAAALVKIRIGQQKFRTDVLAACGNSCGVLNIPFPALLRASHIKPWAVSNDNERLDPNNGIALSAHLDVLFDQGLISFQAGGLILISSKLPAAVAVVLGLINAVGTPNLTLAPILLSPGRVAFLNYHRTNVFTP